MSETKGTVRARKVQQLGRFLSGMVMPNIGAFIAWGLLTALFIPTGWLPNATLARMVDPMVTYLLPLLIGYSGGKMVHGHRGGVVGAVATMGMIVGSSVPMFLGGMVMGPFAGWVIREIDRIAERHIPAGFEMLVNNFSAGIAGGGLAVGACVSIGPQVEFGSSQMVLLVERIVELGILPVASLLIEPAKILFLNNAINHGVLSPLGIEQAAEAGQSILFLLETNPGPGLGILLAYLVFSRGTARQSAPGAILIHFFGGIHEIYFPYILMQPRLLIALVCGGVSGVATFSALNAGLVGVTSPGSIVALAAMSPRGGLLPVLAGVTVSALTTFLLSALLIDRKFGENGNELTQAKEKIGDMKLGKGLLGHDCIPEALTTLSGIRRMAVACDGGMGSSVMGAGQLRTTLAKNKVEMDVISTAIDQLDEQTDLVITHQTLTGRAVRQLPDAVHISITDFMNTPVYQELAQRLAQEQTQTPPGTPEELPVLQVKNIRIGLESMPREEAIRLAGQLLIDSGYVDDDYIEAMLSRESELSTYLGHGVAIPHSSGEAKRRIRHSGISILQFPQGVDFEGETAYIIVGIAGRGNQHLKILASLAKIINDEPLMDQLRQVADPGFVFSQFSKSADAHE